MKITLKIGKGLKYVSIWVINSKNQGKRGTFLTKKKVTKCLILPNALHRYKVEVAQGLVVIRAVRDINNK